MTRDELLSRLAALRQAQVGAVRAPHKPLLLLWLFGQFAATGSSAASYQQAEEPVSQLINDFGPPVASASAARQRAAMPFVHLELAGTERVSRTVRLRPRRRGFAEEVLRAYAYQCAMCGFDGALGHYPVGIEAAHVRWYSQRGPDEVTNALALCALHHALFDLGVLGVTEMRRIRVSSLYVARNEAGQAVDALAGSPLLMPRPRQPMVDVVHISWHHRQVFKGAIGM